MVILRSRIIDSPEYGQMKRMCHFLYKSGPEVAGDDTSSPTG